MAAQRQTIQQVVNPLGTKRNSFGNSLCRLLCSSLAAAVLLTTATVGCNSGDIEWNPVRWFPSDDKTPPKRLTARPACFIAGVPVPSGFDKNEKNSSYEEIGGVRVARQLYVGYAEVYAIREFYKEQMPTMGWQQVSYFDSKGSSSLRFRNATEECTINIEPTGFMTRSHIKVDVKPITNVSEPPTRRPMP